MKHVLLTPLIAWIGLASTHAQLITTVSANAPTTNLAVSFTTASYPATSANTFGMGWKGNTGDRRDLGQTFTPSTSFSLDKITLQLQFIDTGAPGAGYSLSLYEFSSATSLTATNTLGTWSGTLPDASTLAPAAYNFNNGTVGPFLTIDLPDVSLAANTTYGFVLSFTSLASNESISIWTKGGGYYNGGQQIQAATPGATTFTTGSNDLLFYAQAVPEGSTWVMALVGLLVILAIRGRRISGQNIEA